MQDADFQLIMDNFTSADVDGKIHIYCNTAGLTTEQYTKLLRAFPLDKLPRLEAALA